jgi:hypothetical protein
MAQSRYESDLQRALAIVGSVGGESEVGGSKAKHDRKTTTSFSGKSFLPGRLALCDLNIRKVGIILKESQENWNGD